MIQATAQRQLPHHQIKVLEREYIELGRQIMRCIYLVRTTTQLRSTLGYDAVPNIKCKYDREKPVITLSMRRGRIDGQLRFLEAQIESNDNPRSLGEKLGEDARLRYDRTYELYVEVFHKWFDSEGNYTRRPRKEKRKMFPQLLEHVTEVYSREGELRYFEEEIANHQLEVNSVQSIDELFDSLPTENLKTREKHYKDKAGFDCHESIATSFGIIGADGDKSGEEKEKEEGDNLFRIQRRSKNSEEDEKSKAPDFVVKDGFFESAENEGDWF